MTKEIVRNRKAYHDYEIIETFEAGIVLKGTEIKAIRQDGASLQESYVKVINNELWLINAYIGPYRFGNIHNHDERRDRKLLVHKKEIKRLKALVKEKGYGIVALAMYFKKGRVKVKIATCRGKKKVDKRATIKERDEKRRIAQMMKNKNG